MMKQILIVLLTSLYSLAIMAQRNKTISGIARDIRNIPLAGATVNLLNINDTAFIKIKITNDKGRFEFNSLQNGTFIFTVTASGCKKYTGTPLVISDQHLDITIPVIILQPLNNTNLEGLVVRAKRPLLVQDIDKTIVNVDAMISSAAGNTLEVLEKTPGITVSNDGDISLNGKNGALVLIDGRPTYMSGQDLAAYLKSLPGSLLDKIELMDNPPAKYDAAGSAVINIRLKKNKSAGLLGSVSTAYSQGVFARENSAINVSYNRRKFRLFGNAGHITDINYTDDRYNRKFYGADAGPQSFVRLANNLHYHGSGADVRLGMDYAFSPATTYGLSVNINSNTRKVGSGYTSNTYNGTDQPDSSGTGSITDNNKRKNRGLNLNFFHKFNEEGQELTADVNYLEYQTRGNQYLNNFSYLPGNILISENEFLYLLPADITIYTFKADYTHPMKNKASLEAGIKSSVVINDNDSRYFDINGNTNAPDYSKSNHFIYHENIHAAYFNARKSGKRLGAQLGLRLENTRQSGRQLGNIATNGSFFSRDYTGLFPTAFISYKIDTLGNNTLTTSIARRINRPNYQQLNPFLFFRDNYSYTAGNPMINPGYQYRLELKYQRKQWLGLSLQYNHVTNIIFQTTEAIGDIFITRPANVSSGYLAILATNLSLNPATWWNINANIMVAHMELNGTAYTEKLNPGINTARLNIMNQFDFNKGWSAELSGYWSGKDIQGQTIAEPRYRIAAAIQKKILKDKGSVRIIGEDIFHSWIQKDNAVSIKQAQSYHTGASDTQRFGLAFTWRFGNDSFTRKSRHTDNAADAEKGRVD